MTATINQCLAQLQTDLEAALVDTYAKKVYGYRTMPDKLSSSVMLTHLSTGPGINTTVGRDRYYDIAVVMTVQHDGTQSSLETAEQSINSIENTIYDTLDGSRNSLWIKVQIERPSVKPPAPPEMPNVRYGELYFRLHLK